MVLRRDDWLDLARKVDWTLRYVDEREMFPEELSGTPWLAHDAWRDWNEAYRTTYREYVANQRDEGRRSARRAVGVETSHTCSTASIPVGCSWSSSTTVRLLSSSTPARSPSCGWRGSAATAPGG